MVTLFTQRPFRLRKTWKLRGHVSHSRSRTCQHRKLPGCRANTSGVHHHRISFDKDHPAYFEEAGLRCDHSKRNQSNCEFWLASRCSPIKGPEVMILQEP
ncbi:XK-related protein 9 isoform X3 [Ailuropoda melanoleuca]|uniref:XK-related protein 9 isoform X3 n=1 Tax=Ailuropoda melanoleuca TaxID=9646 RepID=UPI0014947F55|nr:XK-related protein 9 isoform X3 [Ailuropoda melanoleuca]